MDEEAIKSAKRLRDALLGLHEKTSSTAATMRETDFSGWSKSQLQEICQDFAEITEDTATMCMALATDMDRLADYLEELKQHLDGGDA